MNEENVLYVVGKKIGSLLSTIWESWNDDKKISWIEIGGVALSGGALLINVFGNFQELKAVLGDGVDSDELDILKAGLLEGYDLDDDETEETQELIINKAVSVVRSIVDFFTGLKED